MALRSGRLYDCGPDKQAGALTLWGQYAQRFRNGDELMTHDGRTSLIESSRSLFIERITEIFRYVRLIWELLGADSADADRRIHAAKRVLRANIANGFRKQRSHPCQTNEAVLAAEQ